MLIQGLVSTIFGGKSLNHGYLLSPTVASNPLLISYSVKVDQVFFLPFQKPHANIGKNRAHEPECLREKLFH